ncbi:MAG: hypothetical protein LBQ81_13480 [Zoogloeaceae bacterium]|jgi:hypothetical protein|nr:hypothetical protein [Zoogloeaceae bacterium]
MMTETRGTPPAGAKAEKKAKPDKLYPAVIAAVIFVGLCVSTIGGEMLAALGILILLLWIVVNIIYACRNPARRKFFLVRICIWVVAFVSVFVSFNIKNEIMRRYANEVIVKIKDFSAAHGRCAQTLAELGIESQEFEEALGRRSGYRCMKGEGEGELPNLYYTDPGSGFDIWHYDFVEDKWTFHPD